jgi:hypothetical protein
MDLRWKLGPEKLIKENKYIDLNNLISSSNFRFTQSCIVVDHAVVGEEGRVADVLEGVAVVQRLQLEVGLLHALQAQQFGVLNGEEGTDLYLSQVAFLSMWTE